MKISQLLLGAMALYGLWKLICIAICAVLVIILIMLCIFMSLVTGN